MTKSNPIRPRAMSANGSRGSTPNGAGGIQPFFLRRLIVPLFAAVTTWPSGPVSETEMATFSLPRSARDLRPRLLSVTVTSWEIPGETRIGPDPSRADFFAPGPVIVPVPVQTTPSSGQAAAIPEITASPPYALFTARGLPVTESCAGSAPNDGDTPTLATRIPATIAARSADRFRPASRCLTYGYTGELAKKIADMSFSPCSS